MKLQSMFYSAISVLVLQQPDSVETPYVCVFLGVLGEHVFVRLGARSLSPKAGGNGWRQFLVHRRMLKWYLVSCRKDTCADHLFETFKLADLRYKGCRASGWVSQNSPYDRLNKTHPAKPVRSIALFASCVWCHCVVSCVRYCINYASPSGVSSISRSASPPPDL